MRGHLGRNLYSPWNNYTVCKYDTDTQILFSFASTVMLSGSDCITLLNLQPGFHTLALIIQVATSVLSTYINALNLPFFAYLMTSDLPSRGAQRPRNIDSL